MAFQRYCLTKETAKHKNIRLKIVVQDLQRSYNFSNKLF